jgi:putative pyruvate formate lyase activating enzyme
MLPSYIALHDKGELKRRAQDALSRLENCRMCPQNCGVNRLQGVLGFCQTGRLAQVASFNLHFGEEAPLVGSGGSGTIFFGRCNLNCVFCQNADISQPDTNEAQVLTEVHPNQLAWIMLELQRNGAHNINFVTPSHVVPQILEALVLAVEDGLKLPLVYNSGGFDALETLQLLDGVVDIYMPDAKLMKPEHGKKYCAAEDYPDRAKEALKEMHRQVGDLFMNEDGIAEGGLLVRHLVMPGGLADTEDWMRFLREEISPNTYVNLMDQYRPCHHAEEYPELDRALRAQEMEAAEKMAAAQEIFRLDGRRGARVRKLWQRLAHGSENSK